MANYHLAILKKPYLDAILEGRKTVESRFMRTQRAGLARVSTGDKIFLKVSSGPVCATAMVRAVKKFENLTPEKMALVKRQYNHLICGDDEYWRSKAECRFGFLAWLGDVRAMEPVRISKRDWRGWVVLTEKENFGLVRSS